MQLNPDQYNVVWDSPSVDFNGSMPIGNGDIGANVWVEKASGDLILLLAKTDAWDENGILLRIGRLRVSLDPPVFRDQANYRQELKLTNNEIEINAGESKCVISCDFGAPLMRVNVQSSSPIGVNVKLECWRTEPRTIKTQTGDIFKNLVGKNSDPFPTVISPDHILSRDNALIWCHRNEARENDGYAISMKLQGLGDEIGKSPHPLLHRTFGAKVSGDGFVLNGNAELAAPSATSHAFDVLIHARHPATIDSWLAEIESASSPTTKPSSLSASENRSPGVQEFGIELWSDDRAGNQTAQQVSRAYALQQHMNRAAGRGAQPIKHNGSIFSVGTKDDPDFRRWGPGYWFQNQRLIYWPMLADGEFDLMLPFFRMYRDCLELQRARTRKYFNHGGAHYPETIYFWGAEVSAHYGWTPFEQRARPEAECAYLTYYWSGGIELTLMMLEYFEYTSDQDFAREFLRPVADAVIEFFDLHYPRDASGKIRFEPGQALETWHVATNPLPETAGLRYVLPRLLATAGDFDASSSFVARCQRLLRELPDLPVGERDGKRVILAAERFDVKKNTENPELYCIFPYRLYGLNKPDLQLARDTFAARLHVVDTCWHQDVIQMALLGLTDDAARSLAVRASPASHSDSRFPAFWNAFHDWIPDIDHGGVLQIALQQMLMQCDGDQIRLLPAWPAKWNARFRLHAPKQTIVSGEVVNGNLTELDVQPAERRKDVLDCGL